MNIKTELLLISTLLTSKATALMIALLMTSAFVNASTLKEYQKLKIYGVHQTSPTSISDVYVMLEGNDHTSSEIESVIHRFLVYDTLKQYLGYLLHVNQKPNMDYFNSFGSLRGYLGENEFIAIQRDAVQTAINLAREVRFDVSLVQLSTKEIYNKNEAEGIESQIEMIIKRLSNISVKLSNLYPQSNGELPPVLLAYVSSVFTPRTETERISCAKKFSEEVKNDVFRILATSELDKTGQLLQSPVIYNISPMGTITSKANQ